MFAMNKYLVLATGALALIVTIYSYGQYKYNQGKAASEVAQHIAELEQFKATAEALNGLSGKFEEYATELRTTKPKIIERITRVEKENPLPVGCVIPANGVLSINQAIDTANAAGKLGYTLPRDQSAK